VRIFSHACVTSALLLTAFPLAGATPVRG